MSGWLPKEEYNSTDKCKLCNKPYGTTKAIYETPCGHRFHNDCLNKDCLAKEKTMHTMNTSCPVSGCGKDIGYACMDVYAFKNKALQHVDGKKLFDGDEHLGKIYNDQNGGNKRKRNKRKTRRGGKKRTTHRRRKTSRKIM